MEAVESKKRVAVITMQEIDTKSEYKRPGSDSIK